MEKLKKKNILQRLLKCFSDVTEQSSKLCPSNIFTLSVIEFSASNSQNVTGKKNVQNLIFTSFDHSIMQPSPWQLIQPPVSLIKPAHEIMVLIT